MAEFVFPLRVYIEDTDYLGIVYYANYLKYFERARSEWAEQLNVGVNWQRQHHIFMTVYETNVRYLRPTYLHQLVEVVTRLRRLNKASMVYDQYLRLQDQKDIILCKCETKVASVGPDLKPQMFPSTITNILRNLISET